MTESVDQASSAALTAMKLPQLQAIATQLGLTGTSRLRKGELIEAIRAGSGSGGRPGRPPQGNQSAQPQPVQPAEQAQPAGQAQPDQRAGRSAGQGRVAGDDAAQAEKAEKAEKAGQAVGDRPQRTATSRGRGRAKATGGDGEQPADGGAPTLDVVAEIAGDAGSAGSTDTDRPEGRRTPPPRTKQAGSREPGGRGQPAARQGGQRGQQQSSRGQHSSGQHPQGSPKQGRGQEDDRLASLDDIIHLPEPVERENESSRAAGESESDRGGRRRRGRDRGRDRKRRNTRETAGFDDEDLHEDDVLVPVAGILDVLDNYAFVRTTGYLPGSSDVYVNLGQVRKSSLRRGDAITGAVRQPRENEANHRQKFNALVRLDSVNGTPVDELTERPEFTDLTTVYPQQPLRLRTGELAPRIIDLVAPLGLGQRVLVHAPSGGGRSCLVRELAAAITDAYPQAHLMMVLLDERPEDVTLMERSVHGEVIDSTFDRPASDHTTVAELAVERAKRLVELGQDVVLLLDSLTALTRAYHASVPSNRAGLGLDADAAHQAKRFLGAARKAENAGSLTMVATLSTDGTELDTQIDEAFEGTSTSQIRLDAALAAAGRFPAVDVHGSATRREDEMFDVEEYAHRRALRRMLEGKSSESALEWLTDSLRERTNEAFLASIKVTPAELAALRRSREA